MIKKKKQMLEGIDAVIFDMDGSLIDSMWIWPAVDDEFLEKYQLKKPVDFHKKMEGMSYTETAQLFLSEFPALALTVEEVKQEWLAMTLHKYTTEVRLKEGVQEFILYMKERGCKLGIATSNARELVDAVLEALEIRELFDSVHTSCEVQAGKPAPDVYLLVAGDLQAEPAKCLVFEDVPMGILAGKNAGMIVCGVDDEYSRPQEAKKKELADYYIQNYRDIKDQTYEVLS